MNAAAKASPWRREMLAKLHVAAKQLGLDEETYRDALEAATGARSARDLDGEGLEKALAHFRARGFTPTPTVRPDGSSTGASSGPASPPQGGGGRSAYLPKIRALWIAGWNLGLVRDPSDKALRAFVARQTGIAHERWLKGAGDAKKVIEALKSWLARDGGVDWTVSRFDPDILRFPACRVALAQWARLKEIGAVEPGKTWTGGPRTPIDEVVSYARVVLDDPGQGSKWGNGEWNRVSRALGKKLRAAMEGVGSPDEAERNPGPADAGSGAPDCPPAEPGVHPGYGR
jgi:phage gp16-like protein